MSQLYVLSPEQLQTVNAKSLANTYYSLLLAPDISFQNKLSNRMNCFVCKVSLCESSYLVDMTNTEYVCKNCLKVIWEFWKSTNLFKISSIHWKIPINHLIQQQIPVIFHH